MGEDNELRNNLGAYLFATCKVEEHADDNNLPRVRSVLLLQELMRGAWWWYQLYLSETESHTFCFALEATGFLLMEDLEVPHAVN